jgi:hypothetical protein
LTDASLVATKAASTGLAHRKASRKRSLPQSAVGRWQGKAATFKHAVVADGKNGKLAAIKNGAILMRPN